MRRSCKMIVVAVLALAGSASEAATRVCRVNPTNVTTDLNGHVYISGFTGTGGNVGTISWAWQLVCGVSTSRNNVSVEACKNWMSTALTAQAQKRAIFIFFDDVQNNGVVGIIPLRQLRLAVV